MIRSRSLRLLIRGRGWDRTGASAILSPEKSEERSATNLHSSHFAPHSSLSFSEEAEVDVGKDHHDTGDDKGLGRGAAHTVAFEPFAVEVKHDGTGRSTAARFS